MKISKRDRNMLILLGVILIFAAYYFLMMKPKETEIAKIKEEIALAETKQLEIQGKLASEKPMDEKINTLRRQLISVSESYYTELGQEEALMIIYDVAKSLDMNLEQFSFSKIFTDSGMDTIHTLDIVYDGDYKELLSFLREIRQHPKKVYVRNLSIETDMDRVKGSFQLEFNVLSSMAHFSKEWMHYVQDLPNERDVTLSPFIPFSDFVMETPGDIQEETVVIPEILEPPVDYETYRPKSTIYGFEDGAYFFVGSTSEIQGVLTRSKTKIDGGYSASMDFDFTSAREFSESSLVFDTDTIVLNRQPESIGLWMYAHEASNHNVGVEIMDAVGKSHKIELTSGVDFTQWKELEAKMPLDLTYPCKVVRVYVEGIGYSQKLTGQYLFDQLQVIYPVE